jgi:hypothetical protein
MTVFSKKRFAFPNPDGGAEIILKDQEFTYTLPDKLREDVYFRMCEADGDIVVMDSVKQVDEVLKKGTAGKRNGAKSEQKPEDLNILDGGDAK